MTTPSAFSGISRLLAERADQLRQEIATAQARGTDGADREVVDRKEEASQESLEWVDSAEVERDMTELRQIAAAQERIAAGRYGLCADCGESIDERRLLAQPTAIRCAACQQFAERGGRTRRPAP